MIEEFGADEFALDEEELEEGAELDIPEEEEEEELPEDTPTDIEEGE